MSPEGPFDETTPAWKVNDRVVWPHSEGVGRDRWAVRSAGTVTGIDLPGLPPGVQVTFDKPVNGASTCYAVHGELEPESREATR